MNLLNCKQNKSRQLCRTSKKLNLISLHFWTHLWIKSCQVGSQVQNEVFNKWVLFPVKSTINRNLYECSFLNKIHFKVCNHQKIAYQSYMHFITVHVLLLRRPLLPTILSRPNGIFLFLSSTATAILLQIKVTTMTTSETSPPPPPPSSMSSVLGEDIGLGYYAAVAAANETR